MCKYQRIKYSSVLELVYQIIEIISTYSLVVKIFFFFFYNNFETPNTFDCFFSEKITKHVYNPIKMSWQNNVYCLISRVVAYAVFVLKRTWI